MKWMGAVLGCRSFDVVSKEPSDSSNPTVDFAALLRSLKGDCKYQGVIKSSFA